MDRKIERAKETSEKQESWKDFWEKFHVLYKCFTNNSVKSYSLKCSARSFDFLTFSWFNNYCYFYTVLTKLTYIMNKFSIIQTLYQIQFYIIRLFLPFFLTNLLLSIYWTTKHGGLFYIIKLFILNTYENHRNKCTFAAVLVVKLSSQTSVGGKMLS